MAFWWYFVGPVWPCVVPRGSLGVLVFELVALVPRVTAASSIERRMPWVAMKPITSADVGTPL
jgi:hypothetical protein